MKSLADRYLSRWYAPHKLNGGRGRKIDSDRISNKQINALLI